MKTLSEWLNEGCKRFCGDSEYTSGYNPQITKRIECNSGLSLSIQASEGHYCSPRENSKCNTYEIYSEFEIGFPSEKIDEIIGYAEQPEIPTDTVYGYVPREVIELVIEKNGGIKGWQTK